ncbi:exopolysaccharide biosynthesis polyprenyl glycosylphosphotransferase [Polaribacter sp. R77954]|uniref:exopolysaccharide biosynthesis polyprenyl glycosylphosphotransferase n=1 Tax=Polaribacter sp. R77954 TaxID=3093870 RepID=UPI0037C5AB89
MKQKSSLFKKPLLILLDVLIICSVLYGISDKDYLRTSFISFIIIFWIFSSYYTKFYDVRKHHTIGKLFVLIFSQFFIFLLGFLSYFSFFKEGEVVGNQIRIFTLIVCSITFFKILGFYILKTKSTYKNELKNIILFGEINSAEKLESLFHSKNELGYRFIGFFSKNKYKSQYYLGKTKDGLKYVDENKIDEIYCNPSTVSKKQLNKIRKFVEENDLELTFLPESRAIYSKDYILEYFGAIPVLKPKPLPFEKRETHIQKRILDIVFSLVVCITILSWLIPILWIIIKIDSKGPLFFKQKRDGIDGKQFYCYKLRSMTVNKDADKVSASKNDKRITRVGAFLRKSSLDELPQFFNVLFGDMSIVGPRPHMNAHTQKYVAEVENYLKRHTVKPGITGLAQISGYRGEVIENSDIKNRVRLDIFYIENWSFILDIKIIVRTFLNVFVKEEKAY